VSAVMCKRRVCPAEIDDNRPLVVALLPLHISNAIRYEFPTGGMAEVVRSTRRSFEEGVGIVASRLTRPIHDHRAVENSPNGPIPS
jgi:hypothetical protein